MKRFRGLTKAQQKGFERIACNLPPGCTERTLVALLDAGLIERTEHAQRTALGTFVHYEHRVPIPVHMEWCEWCSEHLDPSAVPPF